MPTDPSSKTSADEVGHIRDINPFLWAKLPHLWECPCCAGYGYLINTETGRRSECRACQS